MVWAFTGKMNVAVEFSEDYRWHLVGIFLYITSIIEWISVDHIYIIYTFFIIEMLQVPSENNERSASLFAFQSDPTASKRKIFLTESSCNNGNNAIMRIRVLKCISHIQLVKWREQMPPTLQPIWPGSNNSRVHPSAEPVFLRSSNLEGGVTK